MSRSSEEILLQVGQVRHKKHDGTLYMMAERLAWQMKSKDTFAVMHNYTEVKSQKISPEGKAKIQLQLVMHDGSSTTFHFVQAGGQAEQIRERDAVKELLQQLLPKFKKRVNKELEERHRLLSDNPGLLQLYKDLVITQILTAEEFWAQHGGGAGGPAGQAGPTGAKPNGLVAPAAQTAAQKEQKVGVSGSFLSEIKPQADGANGLKYNLTPDIIASIFKTYPAVRRKHVEQVPGKISEQEFWTKFFQSHYFHRDRIHAQGGPKDIFSECAKDDDSAIRAQLKAGVSDRVANIAAFSDQTLGDGYGAGGGKDDKKSNNIVHQSIVKRFNQHAIMVMRATTEEPAPAPTSSSSSAAPAAAPPPSNTDVSRKRLKEKLEYEDLSGPPAKQTATLNLAKKERYLNGPTLANSTEYLTHDEITRSRAVLQQALHDWEHSNSLHCMTAANAVTTLVDLSPGGALMQSSRKDALADHCPEAVQRELRQLYGSICELARHFWACFPPTSPQLQEKASKMHETLQKFQQVKLRPFENELARSYGNASGVQLTSHINQMLDAASRKYTAWKQKKLPGIK